ncbi:MAG: SDR family oxidoreductase [Desulfovibrio sp.]|nr:SDR family oxidoreductase [Desulfovibrio sp.]
MHTMESFRLDDRVVVVTGGAGLLGPMHARAVAEAGGVPVLWDANADAVTAEAAAIEADHPGRCLGQVVDITNEDAVRAALEALLERFGRVHGLVNNAAINPQVTADADIAWSRLENYPLASWDREIAVGLTGALLCSRVVGARLAADGGGAILNIASDLGVIAPDQRLYQQPDRTPETQPVKPVSYSVIKHGLIGLTRYLATYWAEQGVRVNALSPGGVYTGQPDAFVEKLARLIPLGRMARRDEYKAAVVFLLSDAASYMTGANIALDGGRTCW